MATKEDWLDKKTLDTPYIERFRSLDDVFIKLEEWAEREAQAEVNAREREEESQLMWQIVCDLPPLQQQVFKMFHYEGLDPIDIAEVLSGKEATRVRPGTIRKRLHDAREGVEKRLAELGYSVPVDVWKHLKN